MNDYIKELEDENIKLRQENEQLRSEVDKCYLKENKTLNDLILIMKDTVKNGLYFEINEEDTKTLLKGIDSLKDTIKSYERLINRR